MSKSINIIKPVHFIKEIEEIQFAKNKKLGATNKPLVAAFYAINQCFLAHYSWQVNDSWQPLYSQLMGKIAGNTNAWAKIKRALCSQEFLECDDKCKHKVKSYCFKLGRRLLDTEWIRDRIDVDLLEEYKPQMEWLGIDYAIANKLIIEYANAKKIDKRVKLAMVTRIKNFKNSFKICKTGRIYTDANLIPSVVRNALLIDGEKTAEIDIVNCQPLLLATLYPDQSDEWRKYKDLAEKGIVYERFAEIAGLDREAAKKEFIPFLFGAKKPTAEKFFANEFPQLLAIIKNLRKNHYKAMAYLLQKRESEIIVGNVCRRFKAVSIHDGVRVKISEVEEVTKYIQELFCEKWNISPRLTVESSAA
jgi:hypothetical protein